MLFTNSSLLVGLIVFPMVSETENASYYKHLAVTLSVGDNITFIFTQTFNSTHAEALLALYQWRRETKFWAK